MRRDKGGRPINLVVYGLLLLLGGVLVWDIAATRLRLAAPPATVVDYDSFLRWNGPPKGLYEGQSAAGPVTVATAGSGMVLLASGPAGYAFDGNGRLLAWSGDTGDDPAFARQYGAMPLKPIPTPLHQVPGKTNKRPPSATTRTVTP